MQGAQCVQQEGIWNWWQFLTDESKEGKNDHWRGKYYLHKSVSVRDFKKKYECESKHEEMESNRGFQSVLKKSGFAFSVASVPSKWWLGTN